ncbi:MAG TPA: hypothetical protein VFM66_06760 [Agromyces sp.]|nr:hypothetical protein [Agromyces sp.]
MTSRGARTARGAAIAAFATLVASLAHTVGGGAPPGLVAILLALAFSLPLAMLLAGPGVAARARLARTSISALVAQAALHLCYALGAASVALPIATNGHAGHAGTGSGVAMPFDAAMAAPVVDHGHALMPFAHLVAAALTVVALALADNVFDVLHRCVRMLVQRLTSLPTPAVVVPLRSVVVVADPPRLIGVHLRSALWSRGPPAMVAAS